MNLKRTALWSSAALIGLALVVSAPASADQVILDDLIVDGSACIGQDCVNGESFGFDTIRIKENNLRIKAQDTSSTASFPSNDWQITFNDSANGGANKFSIDDIDGGRTPFTIEAGAPSNSLYVDDGGRIGLGTSTPVVEVHIKDGDTPTLRLEQDGSSGFTPQTWDVAGNETNFFIRDATNGSKLPFRIRPDADSNSIFVDTNSNVGMSTSSPESRLHVVTTATGAGKVFEMTRAGNARFEMTNSASSESWQIGLSGGTGTDFIINQNTASDGNELLLAGDGTLTIQGEVITLGCPAPGGCGPADFVFEPTYALMPLLDLQEFVERERHLPNIPSAEEIKRDGVRHTWMQMRLLEKIEELTLYTFQQQETLESLQAQLAELREQDG